MTVFPARAESPSYLSLGQRPRYRKIKKVRSGLSLPLLTFRFTQHSSLSTQHYFLRQGGVFFIRQWHGHTRPRQTRFLADALL
jgi:hypothetical protein